MMNTAIKSVNEYVCKLTKKECLNNDDDLLDKIFHSGPGMIQVMLMGFISEQM